MIHLSEPGEGSQMRQLAIVAHELRNPLAAAFCALRTIERTSRRTGEVEHARSLIEGQLRQLARIVDDLVDVTSLVSGKFSLRKQRVDLAGVVRSAVDSCQHSIEAGSHELIQSLPFQPVYVSADPLRLMQSFINLLDNAAKYSEPGSRIEVTMEQCGDAAVLVVQDNGLGIRPEVLPHIFELFAQDVAPPTGKRHGLGVGLSIAKQLIEQHGGQIEAYSAGLGVGSRFTVRLPVANADDRDP